MLGSDPISALLGAGVNPSAAKVVWKGYVRELVNAGCAVVMLGPDVLVPGQASAPTLRGLRDLLAMYPPSSRMPPETTGKLAGTPTITTDPVSMALRVESYYKLIAKPLTAHIPGRDEKTAHVNDLFDSGVVTPGVGLHVQRSAMVAVEVPDAEAMTRWRTWAFELSDDYHERHCAPTLVMPGLPGGGIFLFRQTDPIPAMELQVNSITVSSGNTIVPVPPTRQGGRQINRIGAVRVLPEWLRAQLVSGGRPEQSPHQVTA